MSKQMDNTQIRSYEFLHLKKTRHETTQTDAHLARYLNLIQSAVL